MRLDVAPTGARDSKCHQNYKYSAPPEPTRRSNQKLLITIDFNLHRPQLSRS